MVSLKKFRNDFKSGNNPIIFWVRLYVLIMTTNLVNIIFIDYYIIKYYFLEEKHEKEEFKRKKVKEKFIESKF